MPHRIAVLDREKCMPRKCNHECQRFCPPQLTGHKVIEFDEDGYPVINESLCIGCNICVRKCPFSALTIVNLADELEEGRVHQYGPNSFRLYRLPTMKMGRVTGVIGRNSVGKTTALNILSGQMKPNIGRYDDPPDWKEIFKFFQGTELREYFERLANGDLKASIKPQMIERIRSLWRKSSRELIEEYDDTGRGLAVAEELGLDDALDKDPNELSGGELQRLAITVTAGRDADAYFFDEPSSYNDVYQRLRVARVIRMLADRGATVLVVDHDLTFLDYVADHVHVIYGEPGVYGIVSTVMSATAGVNALLDGYLPGDNVRFRPSPIVFDVYGVEEGEVDTPPIMAYTDIEKSYPGFDLFVEEGEVRQGEVLGVVGANALGKTTFLKILAGVEKPDEGDIYMTTKISYKPQYLTASYDGTAEELLYISLGDSWQEEPALSEIVRPLGVERLLQRRVPELSGGELQRLAITLCLLREAGAYALDEPSAFLDVEERMVVAKAIQRYVRNMGKSAIVIDHDISLVDIVSDKLVVFTGTSGISGRASSPLRKKEGMNIFLKDLGVTYRRDPSTGRPRVNKPGSRLDRYQKGLGEYYYLAPAGDEG